MKTLIIIPAYNEQENIEKVVNNLIINYKCYDYIIINDGSTDNTKKICLENSYNLLDLPVNLGLSGAIMAGMRYAYGKGYEYVLQLDGDGQHQPQYIERMHKEMEEQDADIVIGSRFKDKKKHFSMRMMGSTLITGAIYVTCGGKYIGDVTSGMRLFNRKMIKRFAFEVSYSPEPDTLAYLLKCGARIEEIQVEMLERTAGESYLNFGRSVNYMLHMLFSILLFQWFRIHNKE